MITQPRMVFDPDKATKTLDALKLVHGEDNPDQAAL